MMTLIAGLATGVGGLMTLWMKRSGSRFLSVGMGFSAGVMIYASMVEMLGRGGETLGGVMGDKNGALATAAAFFGGMLLSALIDKLVPDEQNPHEMSCALRPLGKERKRKNGIWMALAIALHNFPEGMAAFVSAQQPLKAALPVIAALGLHNIPEGISVAAPLLYNGAKRGRALGLSFLAGLSEPLGAAAGYLILRPFFTPPLMGALQAAAAGVMVYISFDELLPGAEVWGEHHLAIYGLVAGMLTMALAVRIFA